MVDFANKAEVVQFDNDEAFELDRAAQLGASVDDLDMAADVVAIVREDVVTGDLSAEDAEEQVADMINDQLSVSEEDDAIDEELESQYSVN